jgi:chorismate mutase
VRDTLVPFYRDMVLPQLCERADDPDTYGETVYVDADLLELLHERINIGRYVARAKLESTPDIRIPTLPPEELTELLRDLAQEERILAGVRASAERYGVSADVADQLFRWVIEQTISVEVAWLRGLPPASLGR